MAKKLSQRKSPKVLVDFFLQSEGRVKDIPPEILKSLVADYKEREQKHLSSKTEKKWHELYWFDESGEKFPKPELGITGRFVNGAYDSEYWRKPEAWYGRDFDIARYVFALELGDSSVKDPGGFIFNKAFAKAQESNRNGEARAPGIEHDQLKELAVRKGYFDLPMHSRKKGEILDSIIAETGIYKDHKATAQDSRRRHLKRIIEG